MPIYFWNDPDGIKYQNAYFGTFPRIWHHGDFIRVSEHGSIKIFGRSDSTLNPGGVRIGTAEIYRVVESMDSRSEEHTSELQSQAYLVCRLLLEKKNHTHTHTHFAHHI